MLTQMCIVPKRNSAIFIPSLDQVFQLYQFEELLQLRGLQKWNVQVFMNLIGHFVSSLQNINFEE